MSESDCGSISDADVVPPRRVAAASGCNTAADTPKGNADECMDGNDNLENADADENAVQWLVSKMDAFTLHFKCRSIIADRLQFPQPQFSMSW